jgi:hypothetical protein
VRLRYCTETSSTSPHRWDIFGDFAIGNVETGLFDSATTDAFWDLASQWSAIERRVLQHDDGFYCLILLAEDKEDSESRGTYSLILKRVNTQEHIYERIGISWTITGDLRHILYGAHEEAVYSTAPPLPKPAPA